MAWRRTGDIIWHHADLVHWRRYTALGGDELINILHGYLACTGSIIPLLHINSYLVPIGFSTEQVTIWDTSEEIQLAIKLCQVVTVELHYNGTIHDDVIKWKHFLRYWPFVRGIQRSPVNSPHKGQWREALMFPLICVWINCWINNCEAGDLRSYRTQYDVIVMLIRRNAA